ncbi:RelA/SpoT domain-containing protein [Achromobacter xylosoxidans]|uniref:RelA/SpoT domain-containing protein n=1 Tax=Alcaligenes xylosoxydans xylosoxydans TaxID=85698 RepID=UPI00131D3AF4|nr:RelA/SpoT domain-containing protein [Achromobacter xylosoxidans]MCH1993531.1 RelA/SpoT domain-containing protein [Achromobacter xylosoxidans]
MAYSYGDPTKYSKGAVRRAGAALAGAHTPEDLAIVNNWRNSHAYILNTFQATLRGYIKRDPAVEVVFAQRLKRLSTIVDKLGSGRAKDLSSMHDLAGCRLIFNSIGDLQRFRSRFRYTEAKHERIDEDRYDYIARPKQTGYRGVHEVYKYVAKTAGGAAYNGLKIEIQFRTRTQHAWATAVEISDILDGARIKFDRGANPKREKLFGLASEYLARTKEDSLGYFPELSNHELCEELRSLENDLGAIRTLDAARRSNVAIPRRKHIVLHFHLGELAASGFSSAKQAINYRDAVEASFPDDDVVYVTASSPQAVSDAFRNYFRDAADFVGYMRPALGWD